MDVYRVHVYVLGFSAICFLTLMVAELAHEDIVTVVRRLPKEKIHLTLRYDLDAIDTRCRNTLARVLESLTKITKHSFSNVTRTQENNSST